MSYAGEVGVVYGRDYPDVDDIPPPDEAWGDDDVDPYDLVSGGQFIFDQAAAGDAVWGRGDDVWWSAGEPCIVTGPIGVGKTTLLGRLVRARLGLDQQLLGYPTTPGQRRVLYLACDRPRQIARSLARQMSPEDRQVLDDQLMVRRGPPPADLAKHTSVLLDMCRKADADTVIVDGLKDVALELSKDEVGAGLNQALQRCVAAGIEVVAGHHQRKAANGVPHKPRSLSDLYGSTWIGAGAGTVILLWADQPGAGIITVETLKPAVEQIGPLDVRHDLTRGQLTPIAAITVEEVLRGAVEPVTIVELAAAVHHDTDRNVVERVRRQLSRLERDGFVDVVSVPRSNGGRAENRFLWRAR